MSMSLMLARLGAAVGAAVAGWVAWAVAAGGCEPAEELRGAPVGAGDGLAPGGALERAPSARPSRTTTSTRFRMSRRLDIASPPTGLCAT